MPLIRWSLIQDLLFSILIAGLSGYMPLSWSIIFMFLPKTHNLNIFLSQIINKCFRSGVFPDVLKIAKVSPLFKSNDFTEMSNYRPISLISVFAKVHENIIKHRLYGYLATFNISTGCQHEFRKSKNITDACLTFQQV